MFSNVALRSILKASTDVFRESGVLSKLAGSCSAVAARKWTCGSVLTPGPGGLCGAGRFAIQPAVRHYARAARTRGPARKTVPESQLSDLPPTMLKMDFAKVPLAQTTDDVVKRLLSLELASHSDKLQLKKQQLITMVQKNERDRSSAEVKIAILTARIRNYQEHLQKHRKDMANKRRMLMAIDSRKKLLKNLRLVNYDSFENVCEKLGITYTFPPEYYRRITRRWLAKKAFCIKVYQETKKLKAEQKLKPRMKRSLATTRTAAGAGGQ
ncbi:small ribosomal subunit protein uS15m [Genypterus blacodes]|uniref:small ribosomal subunit protein uS15m n=1 Tax=Genypterus blacodes TaxID=154954 RepID=UPI003F760EF7